MKARFRKAWIWGVALAAAGGLAAGPAARAQGKKAVRSLPPLAADAPAEIQQGSVRLGKCDGFPGYCGHITRELDPAGQVKGQIWIYFEIYRHRDLSRSALEPIVAVEGGPGYPSTGSAVDYVELFDPLLDRRDLLTVDNRGTGHSEAIDCPLLQSEPNPKLAGVAGCGDLLGHRADLYGTGLAADDLAAVLDALGYPVVNLYGDSYGTYFGQAFAGRHPGRLRSVVLDSAYPVVGESPWYPEAAPAMRRAFNAACERTPTCKELPGDSLERIIRLLESLRKNPIVGMAPNGDGDIVEVKATPTTLAYLAFSNATDRVVYRDLDAATRAYFDQDDPLPLLRLLAENHLASVGGGPMNGVREYSQGLFVAVSCEDYPQVYEMTSPPEARLAQREQSYAEEEASAPSVYGPFTIGEFSAIPLDSSVLDLCLPWPVPSSAHPPGRPVPPGATFTNAPVLIFSGDLDSLTPIKQGAEAAAEFADARQIIAKNSFHVVADGDEDNCASVIARRFVETLDPGNTSCADRIAEVRVVPKFAETAFKVEPAVALPGNRGTREDLQVVAAAAAAGDVLARWWVNLNGNDVGLRGGRWSTTANANGDLNWFEIHGVKFTNDVAISGLARWDYLYPGQVRANLIVEGPEGENGHLEMTWQDRQPLAMATIKGTIGGRAIVAEMPAP